MAALNIPKRKKMTAESLYKKATSAGDKLGRAASLGSQMLFGEDTGDGIVKDLAYGVVPGGSLYQRAVTGTHPGALDYLDVVPGVGTGLKFAMTPIAAAFSRDLLKGGKGRLGKTAKNIAQTREARDFVHRVHRTRKENTRSIDQNGLLIGDKNRNFGRNTGDTDDYPASVWLGFDPTNVPVLQYYYTHGPDTRQKLATYRVRIPREVYNNTPRVKFEGGRGGKPKIVGKGESSITTETARRTGNETLIDVFSDNIPPEWIYEIPPDEFEKLVKRREHRESLVDLYNKFYGDMETDITPHDLSKFERNILDVEPSLETRTKPSLIGLPMEPVNEELSESLGIYSGLAGKYRPSPSKVFDELLDRNQIMITRPEEAMQSQTGNWKDLIETSEKASDYTGRGAISRGHLYDDHYSSVQFPPVGERNYRWDKYRAAIAEGLSPAGAHRRAMPDVLVDWSTGTPSMIGENPLPVSQIAGSVSRGELGEDTMPIHLLKDLVDNPSSHGLTSGLRLASILEQTNNPSRYLEYFGKSNIPDKDNAYKYLQFTVKPGSIARGNKEWAPRNEILDAQNIRKNRSDPEKFLSPVKRGMHRVVEPKDNYYNKTLYEIMNNL